MAGTGRRLSVVERDVIESYTKGIAALTASPPADDWHLAAGAYFAAAAAGVAILNGQGAGAVLDELESGRTQG